MVLALHHFRSYLYERRFQLRTDHAYIAWLLNFQNPEGQVARWLKILQDYDFEVQHRASWKHENADALSRRRCKVVDCQNCGKQEEWEKAEDKVVVRQVDGGEGACDPLEPQELQWQQEADPALKKLLKWLVAGAAGGNGT